MKVFFAATLVSSLKKQATIHCLAGLLGMATLCPLWASPLISIGDSIDILFRGSVSWQYTSNVFNNPQKQEDYLYIFSPGVEIDIGRNVNANAKVIFREDISWYHHFSSQNSQLSNLFADAVYNSGRLTSDFTFSFIEKQENTAATAGVGTATEANQVERDEFHAAFDTSYDISPKTYATAKFEWDGVYFTNNEEFGNTYSDRDVYSIPLDLLYRYNPKASVGLGYRIRYTDVANNQSAAALNSRNPGDFIDNFVSLSTRGELFPKLETKLNLGWQNRHFNTQGRKDEDAFSMLSAFDYEFSPKLFLTTGFERDFGTSAIGQSTINTGGFLGGTYLFSDYVTASTHISVKNTDYQNDPRNRSDDTIRVGSSISYAPNFHLRLTASHVYLNNDSNVNTASFMGHVIRLSASLRY